MGSKEGTGTCVIKQQVEPGTVRSKGARSWGGGIITAAPSRVHATCMPGSVLSHLFNPRSHLGF